MSKDGRDDGGDDDDDDYDYDAGPSLTVRAWIVIPVCAHPKLEATEKGARVKTRTKTQRVPSLLPTIGAYERYIHRPTTTLVAEIGILPPRDILCMHQILYQWSRVPTLECVSQSLMGA